MEMKLEDVLNLPCFAEAKVVAGQDGLKRDIRTVNMMDAPDIADFLKSGELLVTTAYSMKDSHEKLEGLVCSMTTQGCAGLAIKTKRYLQDIPERVKQIADLHGFPVIELAPEPSLGEVVNETLSLILESKTRELTYALQTQRTWTELILHGQGLDAVVEQFSTILDAAVMIVDEYGTEYALSHTLPADVRHLLVQQLQAYFQIEPFRNGMQAFSIVGRSDGSSVGSSGGGSRRDGREGHPVQRRLLPADPGRRQIWIDPESQAASGGSPGVTYPPGMSQPRL
jgi:PucR family transcriptional regulator, purine catabolism regulatory protein